MSTNLKLSFMNIINAIIKLELIDIIIKDFSIREFFGSIIIFGSYKVVNFWYFY